MFDTLLTERGFLVAPGLNAVLRKHIIYVMRYFYSLTIISEEIRFCKKDKFWPY